MYQAGDAPSEWFQDRLEGAVVVLNNRGYFLFVKTSASEDLYAREFPDLVQEKELHGVRFFRRCTNAPC